MIITLALGASQKFPQDYQFLPDQIIVKVAHENTDVASIQQLAGRIDLSKSAVNSVQKIYNEKRIKSVEAAKKVGLFRIYKVPLNAGTDILKLCAELNRNPEIEWAEPVYIIPQDAVPNDPMYGSQTHLSQIHASEAWDVAQGSATVPIAIIDSGVDFTHPDLAAKIWLNPGEDINSDGVLTAADSNGVDDDGNGYIDDFHGWDYVDGVGGTGTTEAPADEDADTPDNNVMDVNGHGSHCAGLAAAVTNNGVGVAGVSNGCTIMPIRAGWLANDGNGYLRSDWQSAGFIYAADNGAKVANLSSGASAVVIDAARYAYEKDVCITTSAGNDSLPISKAMCDEPWVCTVVAVDPYDVKAWYSDYGWVATVAAPGGDHQPGLWSTTPNNSHNGNSYYNAYSGTSMSSPVAAGVLGLIRSQHPEWTALQAYYQLVGTTDPIDDLNPRFAGLLGSGRINAYRAVTETVVPKPKIACDRIEFFDPSGNNNGLAEPGEDVNVIFHIENRWAGSAGITAKIIPSDSRIAVVTSSVSLDTLYGIADYPVDNNNSANPLTVHISDNLPPCIIPAQLVIESATFSDTFDFIIAVHPQVLFVEDTHGGGDGTDISIKNYYTNALDELGVAYEYIYRTETPDSNYIQKFPIIIWGCEWAFPSLDSLDRVVLKKYLESGGRLFISGQDVGWDLADLTGTANQAAVSGGASKPWYEKYLASSYVSDNGGVGPIRPSDDSFFNLTPFEFQLPGRVANSYPSVIEPLTDKGGYSVLAYSSGAYAAVAADSPYKTVNFAFGGLEAISNSDIRTKVLQQILNHFTEIQTEVVDLPNTELKGPFTVTATVATAKTIATAQLWYKYDDGDWTFQTMTNNGSGVYSADLPVVSAESADISYYVFIKASDGTYFADEKHSFFSGPDIVKPVASASLIPFDTIDKLGPYAVSFKITDNMAVDTNNVKIHYFSTAVAEDSTLIPFESGNTWAGDFTFSTPVSDGDSIKFYITYKDLGATPNYARLPETGYYSFGVQNQTVVDNFESGLSRWINEDELWSIYALPSALRQDGMRALVSGNGVKYPVDMNSSIIYNNTINLKSRQQAVIKFIYLQMFDNTGDTAYFEIKVGDNDWQVLQEFCGTNVTKWKELIFDLTPYCGNSAELLAFRYRLKSDSVSGSKVGLIVDKIQILTDDAVGIEKTPAAPLAFKLSAAYPNPFNATITLPFALPKSGKVEMTIYDLLGKEVYHTNRTYAEAGYYNLQWNGVNNNRQILSSGVYFVQIKFNNTTRIQKILLTK
jgi:subtilisin family serine protease